MRSNINLSPNTYWKGIAVPAKSDHPATAKNFLLPKPLVDVDAKRSSLSHPSPVRTIMLYLASCWIRVILQLHNYFLCNSWSIINISDDIVFFDIIGTIYSIKDRRWWIGWNGSTHISGIPFCLEEYSFSFSLPPRFTTGFQYSHSCVYHKEWQTRSYWGWTNVETLSEKSLITKKVPRMWW